METSLKTFVSCLWEGYRFEILAPIGSHVNENEKKKSYKNVKIGNFLNFVRILETKMQESEKKNGSDLWEG